MNVLKIKSYLTEAKSLPYKDYCIYLKKVYGKYIYIFVTYFFKGKCNIPVLYTYFSFFHFFIFMPNFSNVFSSKFQIIYVYLPY